MSLRFRPEVAEDLRQAKQWYAARSATLPSELVAEIELQLGRIEGAPAQFPVVHRGVRRALIRRFPYAVFFRIDAEGLLVLAILHQAMQLPSRIGTREGE